MSSFSKQTRMLALEALLAHFPNPHLVALGVERTHGRRLARALPFQMDKLRAEVERELRLLRPRQLRRTR